jgi:hypothetical protein
MNFFEKDFKDKMLAKREIKRKVRSSNTSDLYEYIDNLPDDKK